MTVGVARESRGAVVTFNRTSILTTPAIPTGQAQCSPLQNRQRNDLMRKTALILAGAAAFDLGVMAVAAQAQQAQGSPTSGPTTTGQAPAGIRGGFIIPLVAGRARSETTGDQSSEATRATDGHKIEGVAGVRACSPGAAGPCRDPAPFDPSAPAVPAAAQRSATTDLYMKTSGNLRYLKIDNTHTARTCIAQRGEVIMREGVQQCALPADPGSDRVGPNRR